MIKGAHSQRQVDALIDFDQPSLTVRDSARIAATVRFVTGSTAAGAISDQRLEDESAVAQSRMRNAQLGRVDDPVVEEQQVEIQRPLAPSDRPDAAELRFDLLQHAKQSKRVEGRLEQRRGVQEHPLARRAAHRLGLVERADLLGRQHPAFRPGATIAPSSAAWRSPRLLPRPIKAREGMARSAVYNFSLPIRSTASSSRGVSTVRAARM